MGVRGGAIRAFPLLETELKNRNIVENMKSVAQFRLIGFVLAMTVHLPVRHSHCARARFTVLVSCSRELAVRLCSIAWPNLGVDSSAVGLYCVTIPWFTSSYDSRHFAACCCLLLNADIAARQWLLIAVSHAVLYCVKRSQSESIAMQPQVWNIHWKCETERNQSWVNSLIQRGPTTFYLRAILQKRDNLRAIPIKWCGPFQ